MSVLAHTDLCHSVLKSANDALPHIANQEQREKRYTENLAQHEVCEERGLTLIAAQRDNLWRSIPLILAFDAVTVAFGRLVVWPAIFGCPLGSARICLGVRIACSFTS